MRCALVVLALLLGAAVLPATHAATPRGGHAKVATTSTIVFDGQRTRVRWTDGDSLRLLDGPQRGHTVRVLGFNTLEAYGPVHRWGTWTPAQLLALAHEATRTVRAREWTCTSTGTSDGYGRLLAACPDAARELVGRGLALVFAVDETPDAGLVAAQQQARAARRGMWERGAPVRVVTSVHSTAEQGGGYDRVADTVTGRTEVVRHDRAYATCEEVCRGEGADRSCMVYVPFEERYRGKPACLR